ncbi:MAG: molecular chaperone HtpG, partial [Promethearchaeota archaeon]
MENHKTYEFKAEIKKLLGILSKSLYKNREIFLRELISNSSDALKKIQFIALQEHELKESERVFEIEIELNEIDRTLTVKDSGIGMTKEDLINNLGTIAGSGSEKFLNQLKESEDKKKEIDLDIIGQFGVGFYSVFMVADKVRVRTKSYLKDQPAFEWISEGTGDFTINPIEKEDRGTEITLYLKDDEEEFLQSHSIENIIKKYSNFVPFPIYINEIKKEEPVSDKKEPQVVDIEDETDQEGKEEVEEPTDAEIVEKEGEKQEEIESKDEEDEEEKEEPPAEPERKSVNEIIPLWKRTISEITDEQYQEFYQFIARRYDKYNHVINYKVDGRVQFHSIMYIPETKSQDLLRPEVEYGLDLYSKNIMIIQNCKDVIPQWMRFVKGVVDSEDIPLNISRETIQTNRVIMMIQDLVVKKILNELSSIAENDKEKYIKIWHEFGIFLKEGIVTDQPRQEKLMKLLRIKTSKTDKDETIGLEDYIKRMKEDQSDIFYLAGENYDTMRFSPHLDYYNEQDIEVVLFDEPIDNFLMMNVRNYNTKIGEGEDAKDKAFQFKAIDEAESDKSKDKEENKDDDSDKDKETEEQPESEEIQNFLKYVKDILGDKIVDAKISHRLVKNACRLANPSGGMTSSMQRAMRYW